jgi:formyltetrahydrofolate hydrolase
MHLFEAGWHIVDAQQHDDRQSGCFFMRLVLDAVRPAPGCVTASHKALSDHFGLEHFPLRLHRILPRRSSWRIRLA